MKLNWTYIENMLTYIVISHKIECHCYSVEILESFVRMRSEIWAENLIVELSLQASDQFTFQPQFEAQRKCSLWQQGGWRILKGSKTHCMRPGTFIYIFPTHGIARLFALLVPVKAVPEWQPVILCLNIIYLWNRRQKRSSFCPRGNIQLICVQCWTHRIVADLFST